MNQSTYKPSQKNVFRGWKLIWILCMAWGSLFSEPASAGVNAFTAVGPEGGGVSSLQFHPSNSSIAYASVGTAFYRSTDGGASWNVVTDNFISGPRGIAVHPSKPNRVFVLDPASGVWASSDSGATLSLLPGFPNTTDFGFQLHYSADATTLYAATGSRLYRSTDDGVSWHTGGAVPNASTIFEFAIDPTNPANLYLLGNNGSTYQSNDGGDSWNVLNHPSGTVVWLAVANETPVKLWALTTSGLSYSTDGGQQWTLSLATNAATYFVVSPSNPATIYLGTVNGLQRTVNDGASWAFMLNTTQGGQIFSIAVDRSNAAHVIFGGADSIVGTTDGGSHWTLNNRGVRSASPAELVSSAQSDRIYVVHQSGRVFAMNGADESVTDLNSEALRTLGNYITLGVSGLYVSRIGTSDRLYLTGSPGVVRSDDAGSNWTRLSSSVHGRTLLGITGDGQTQLLVSSVQSYRSVDGGNNWLPVGSAGPAVQHSVAQSVGKPTTVYMTDTTDMTTWFLKRSVDGGENWSPCQILADQSVISAAVDPTDERVVYAGTGKTVLKSTDSCASWHELTLSQSGADPVWVLAIDPQRPNTLYAASSAAIWRSINGGDSWQQLEGHARPYWNVMSLLVDPLRPHKLFAGVGGRGVRQIMIEPDLALDATIPSASITRGTTGSYQLTLKNNGPFDATGVKLSLQLGSGATNAVGMSSSASCSTNGTLVACSVTALKVNDVISISVTDTESTAGSFTLTASVQSDQPDLQTSNNSWASNITVADAVATPTGPPSTPTTPSTPSTGGGKSGGGGGSLDIAILGLLELARRARSNRRSANALA